MSYREAILEIITRKIIIRNLIASFLYVAYYEFKTRTVKSTEAPY